MPYPLRQRDGKEQRQYRATAEAGAALFGTMDSWLIWNLTGGTPVTELTTVSRAFDGIDRRLRVTTSPKARPRAAA